MGWLTRLFGVEQRTDIFDPSASYPDIDAQLLTMQRANRDRVVPPTIKEALGVPAVLRAVSLIATTIASLDLRAYDRDRRIIDPAPSVVRRPAKSWRPFDFWRDTALYMATRGESIWLTLSRDFDGFPLDIVPVVPESIKSEWDGLEYQWFREVQGRRIPYNSRDVTHVTLLRDATTGRGMGPLQLCGAALTVAEEADRWASRFFSGGGNPSVYLESEAPLSQDEADAIKLAWLRDPPNMPKVGHGLKPDTLTFNAEQSQLIESRLNNRAEVALMFGISGRLLEYAASGSAITYANVGDLATELLRLTLAPYYLEPLEQAFSDLLPRGTEARFDVDGLQRADPKTRYEIHEKAIKLGVYSLEHAQEIENIDPDDAGEPAAQPQLPPPQQLPVPKLLSAGGN